MLEDNRALDLKVLKFKGLTLIDDIQDQEVFLHLIEDFISNGNLGTLVAGLKCVIKKPARLQLFDDVRKIVPTRLQMDYNLLVPYTSNRMRNVRLLRRNNASFGFAIRGGREHGTGFFVSEVDVGSEAHVQGLRIGDQIVRINGFSVEDAIHHEVLQLIRNQNHLYLKVRSVGMIPVKDTDFQMQEDDLPLPPFKYALARRGSEPKNAYLEKRKHTPPADFGHRADFQPGFRRSISHVPLDTKRNDPLTWKLVEEEPEEPSSPPLVRVLSSSSMSGSRCEDARDVKIYLNLLGHSKLGCGICKGPEWKPGIFVQFTKEAGLARDAGLRPGDQILECNGTSFDEIHFSDAVNLLKSSKQLELIVRKGAGQDLFPGESSGYNSSASSVNGDGGDQSPSWEEKKRLSIVKEEVQEEKGGQIEDTVTIDRNKEWDEIEYEWEKAEKQEQHKRRQKEVETSCSESEENVKQGRKTVIHVGKADVPSDVNVLPAIPRNESRRNSDELSDSQETTVVVEVHRSELDDAKVKEERASAKKKLPEPTSPSPSETGSITNTTTVSTTSTEEDKLKEEKRKLEEQEKRLKEECERLAAEKKQFEEEKQQTFMKSSTSSSSTSLSSLSSAISQELLRRVERREEQFSEGSPADSNKKEEYKKDILKAIDDEKRQQHEQLMEEFKRAHRKMFAHTLAAKNDEKSQKFKATTVFSKGTAERESFIQKQKQKEEQHVKKMSQQQAVLAAKERELRMDRDRQDTDEAEREVNKLKVEATGFLIPKSPPPYSIMNSSTTKKMPPVNRAPVVKTFATVQNKIPKPPACPTPDYDSSPSQTTSRPSHQPSKDGVEMPSMESFSITQIHKPVPPSTYFPKSQENNARPVSITIGEYPTGAARQAPMRFDFLPSKAGAAPQATSPVVVKQDAPSTDYRANMRQVSSQLQSELVQTLSRANLKNKTTGAETIPNGTTAQGTVTVSINGPPSNGKISSVFSNKTSAPAPPTKKEANIVYNNAEKIMNALANKVTIRIHNDDNSAKGNQLNGILKNGMGGTERQS